MTKLLKILFFIAALIYPILVFLSLVILRIPVRIISLFMIVPASTLFFSITGKKKSLSLKNPVNMRMLLSSAIFFTAGFFCFITNKAIFIKLYSFFINAVLLFTFVSSLFFEPNICFRFAALADKSIFGSAYETQICNYCKKVTILWCIFFILNGTIALYTALFCSSKVWSIYNGGISYLILGLIFSIEFLVRKWVEKKMIKLFPITKFKSNSREDEHILCFEDKWEQKKYKTWRDFLSETAKMRAFINSVSNEESSWILHCADYWYFLVCFTALLQCKKQIILTQNISDKFINEIKTNRIKFITDQKLSDSFFVEDILETQNSLSEKEIRKIPEINADDTRIIMYTSGSTGLPKAVIQRMTEFEADNAFVISKWLKNKNLQFFLTTVSQHHIYGLLFGICLPFTLGIPFRRTRISFPEEFENLLSRKSVIVTTPAFLKRTVEIEKKLSFEDLQIFASGGALSKELAVKTAEVFGCYPLEIYGSTETSGIAYRVQNNNSNGEWTPFDNVQIKLEENGCLCIKSPYIKDSAGFVTADLAEIFPSGRFILKGRSDSVVKIEEKRVSLTETENRLLKTGLIKDVKVIALSNEVRQYLAAAIVLNDKGKEKFSRTKKYLINRHFHEYLMHYFENAVIPKKWRYVDFLPADTQGKNLKREIEALFQTEKSN